MWCFVDFSEQQGKFEDAIRTCDELSHLLVKSVHPITHKVRDKRKKLQELHDQPHRGSSESLTESTVPLS
jgi:hypothetical protein